jgi:putative methionine-R-sulfoxide reductase with GAF domain
LINAFFETKTFKKLDEVFSSQVTNINPDFILVTLYILLGVFILYWVVRIYKLYKAPGSDLIREYKENLQKTMADSEQKSQILTLIDQVNKEIPELSKLSAIEDNSLLVNRGRKVTDMIIEQIPLTLKSMKNINHRCAVFTVDPENAEELKIFEGCGFSITGKEKLRLKINSSIAGNVFANGEYSYCKDVTKEKDFKPHPKATKNYKSLLCVPIKIDGFTVAVLSIDGSEVNCFSQDDISYFQIFSNQLAIIFDIMGKDILLGGMTYGEEVQNIG